MPKLTNSWSTVDGKITVAAFEDSRGETYTMRTSCPVDKADKEAVGHVVRHEQHTKAYHKAHDEAGRVFKRS